MKPFDFQPIGFFHSLLDNPNEAPRQPNLDIPASSGVIELKSGFHFEEALRDLDGFTKIWVIFNFHKNDNWNPTVLPPRGSDTKRGVFSTRSPYRPNPIGISVLDLVKVDGLFLTIGACDLLNATPILDIKPYLPSIDSHPSATEGWLKNIHNEKFEFNWSQLALNQLLFLEEKGLSQLRGFAVNQLEYEPLDRKKKRLYFVKDKVFLAYRTWRIQIAVDENKKQVNAIEIFSAYSYQELNSEIDTYIDKDLHRQFNLKFS